MTTHYLGRCTDFERHVLFESARPRKMPGRPLTDKAA